LGYEATGQNAKAAEEFKTALTKAPDSGLTDAIRAELKKTAIQ
jgi:hypothetical protein